MAAPKFDVVITGNGLNSFGFLTFSTWNLDGITLDTFGFITPCDAIWFDCCPNVTTVWEDCVAADIPGGVEVCAID